MKTNIKIGLTDKEVINNRSKYGSNKLTSKKEELTKALDSLGENIIRAKGIVPNKEGGWIFFDYVPGDADIREGSAAYTGLITVIGVKVDIEQIKDIFGVK